MMTNFMSGIGDRTNGIWMKLGGPSRNIERSLNPEVLEQIEQTRQATRDAEPSRREGAQPVVEASTYQSPVGVDIECQ
jgi:hypothetical protein